MSKKSPFFVSSVGNQQVGEDDKLKVAQSWSEILIQGELSGQMALELPSSRRNLIIFLLIVAFIFSFFTWQLFNIQIVRGQQYQGLARGNRIRDEITYAPRGAIYDRNGIVLAENIPSFQLVVTPYLLDESSAARQEDIRKIAEVSEANAADINKVISEAGLDHTMPVLLDGKVSHQEALKIEQILPRTSGFELNIIPIRQYRDTGNLSHILGYVGRVNENDLLNRKDVLPIDFIGRAGIEAQYDKLLRGTNGQQRTEIDALGRPTRILANQASQQGSDLTLTIDYKLQEILDRELNKQIQAAQVENGSVLAINPKTGEILAMVSVPGYNNNDFAGGISTEKYQSLINNPSKPLFNRAVSGAYPAGSTVKPVVAAAALQENIIAPTTVIKDYGELTLINPYNRADSITFTNYQGRALGPLTVREAIAKSSNVFFFTVSGGHGSLKGMGPEKLAAYYREFGFGSKTGIDLPDEITGVVPDPQWKKQVLGTGWFTGDTYNIAIGQGDMQVTPLQVATTHSSLVNGGKIIKPYLFLRSNSQTDPKLPGKSTSVPVNKEHLAVVKEGLRAAVTEGTIGNSYFAHLPVPVAGKTGTAETVTRTEGDPHIWLEAHAPYGDPEIMIVGMIEQGRFSSTYLAPVAAAGFEYYFSLD